MVYWVCKMRNQIWVFLTFVLEFVYKYTVTNNVTISINGISPMLGLQVVIYLFTSFLISREFFFILTLRTTLYPICIFVTQFVLFNLCSLVYILMYSINLIRSSIFFFHLNFKWSSTLFTPNLSIINYKC